VKLNKKEQEEIHNNLEWILALEDILMEKDFYLETFGTEWFYLVDYSWRKVYYATDYHFDKLIELIENGEAFFPYAGELDNYKIEDD